MYDTDRTASFADMHAMICRDYSMIRSDWSADDRVRARLTFRRLDDVGVGDMSIHASRAWLSRRRASEIRIDPRPNYLLMMMSAGRARFSQGTHDWHLNAGDLVLWDQSRPFDLMCEPCIRVICVTIPYESRLASEVALDHSVGLRVSGRGPFGAFAGTMVRQMVDLDLAGVDLAHDVARSALTTIAVTFGSATVATTGPSRTADRDLRRRIKAWLLANLHEPDIDVDAIGAAHGISGRTVHRIFAVEASTPMAWVRQQRLSAAYIALANEDLTVTQAAIRAGYTDSAHFTRAFKRRYNVAPKTLARRNRTDDTGDS